MENFIPYFQLINIFLGKKISTNNNQNGLINSRYIKDDWTRLMSAPFPECDIDLLVFILQENNICIITKLEDNTYNISLKPEDVEFFNKIRNIHIDKINTLKQIDEVININTPIEQFYTECRITQIQNYKKTANKLLYDRFHLQINNTCIDEFENPNDIVYKIQKQSINLLVILNNLNFEMINN